MANCLQCEHIRIFPKDMAIARMANDPHTEIQHKCVVGNPKIRKYSIRDITQGQCSEYKPNK